MGKPTLSLLDLIIDALEARFLAKVDKNGPVPSHRPELGPCWLRNPTAKSTTGYDVFGVAGKTIGSHRVAYELWVGPIPAGMEIDHVCHPGDGSCPPEKCRHRRCVNPSHLEVVTPDENKRRSWCASARNGAKTHCVRGHEFTPENTRIKMGRWGNEVRGCRKCEHLANPLNGRPDIGEVNAAKTHCPAGHEYTPENTIIDRDGRRCRVCRREQQRQANRVQREKRKSRHPVVTSSS